MKWTLGIALGVFFALMVGISLWSRKRVHTGEDFIVAGRNLPAILTTATIMATWYAAETILVTADVVRVEGLRVTALEPIGISLALFTLGFFFARRLWACKFLTLADVIGWRFGPLAERIQALLSIGYVGWVSVQLVGLAGVFKVYFGLPLSWGITSTALVLTLYTLIGGMWSVAITDFVQLGLLLVGVVALTIAVLNVLGGSAWGGLQEIVARAEPGDLVLLPVDSLSEFQYWLGLIVVGMFGNIAATDTAQRMFAARSARAASGACLTSGVLYLVFGSLPVLLGLAGNLLLDDSVTEAVIPSLAEAFFSPPMAIIFALTLTAAVTSSVDSGLLAPASAFAKNIITPLTKGRFRLLPLTRVCVAVAALISTGLALSGTRGFELLQSTYALGIPSFVVLTFALYQKRCVPLAGVATLAAGVLVWLYETVSTVTAAGSSGAVFSPVFPVVLLGISFAVYLVTDRVARWFGQQGQLAPRPDCGAP